MATKNQIINELKSQFATLRLGNDDDGYTELSAEEYDAVINEWADARLTKQAAKVEAEAKVAERQAILDRLGLTADEAKLLLG